MMKNILWLMGFVRWEVGGDGSKIKIRLDAIKGLVETTHYLTKSLNSCIIKRLSFLNRFSYMMNFVLTDNHGFVLGTFRCLGWMFLNGMHILLI